MSWLWKGDTSSPAQFEKALAKLATQITSANVALEASRSRGRRIKALWTLYTVLTYLLYTLIITLVLGPQKWAIPHYAGLAGGPLVIYGVRRAIVTFFDWRIKSQQGYLDHLQKQRDGKIADLKKATRYDSTQELLQKYGGVPTPKATPQKQSPSQQPPNSKRKTSLGTEQRTGLAPPPTANIPGRTRGHTSPITPQRQQIDTTGQPPIMPSSQAHSINQSPSTISPDAPGFAPNAFPSSPSPYRAHQVNPSSPQNQAPPQISHHWYDRILDVLLGEDETSSKNRLALLCQNCRLVNGLAPPGIKTLEEIGKWRCSSCGALNGIENEGIKAVKEMVEKAKAASSSLSAQIEETPLSKLEEVETIEGPTSPEEQTENEKEKKPPSSSTTSKRTKTFSSGADVQRPTRKSTGDSNGTDEDDSEDTNDNTGGVTKRVTRSTARKSSKESL